jgi:hypothetical protein
MVLILSSLGPNTVRTLEQMGLGEEYNSVAETDDSGLFFQWWDGLKVHKGGEVSSSKSPLIPIPDNPRSDIHKVSPFRRPPRPTPRSPARFPPRKRHSPPRRPRHRRQEPHIRRQSPNHIHCFPTSAWLHACPSRRCSTRQRKNSSTPTSLLEPMESNPSSAPSLPSPLHPKQGKKPASLLRSGIPVHTVTVRWSPWRKQWSWMFPRWGYMRRSQRWCLGMAGI